MNNQSLAVILLILAGMLLETWKIGKQPAERWDEARRGINAVSMMENKDYFHYYYLDRPDTFNTKPPLTVWLIILSFKSFGISNFALRFHSIVAIFFFLLFISKLILLLWTDTNYF
ncbi:MAG: ArnT family glycosyltransferase [Bacteroidota bacterium]